MIKLDFSTDFRRDYKDLITEDLQGDETRELVDQALFRFGRNPSDTRLSNHALSGKLYGFWGKNLVQLLAFGPHQKVYGIHASGTST